MSVGREEEGGGRREVNLKLTYGVCLYLSGIVGYFWIKENKIPGFKVFWDQIYWIAFLLIGLSLRDSMLVTVLWAFGEWRGGGGSKERETVGGLIRHQQHTHNVLPFSERRMRLREDKKAMAKFFFNFFFMNYTQERQNNFYGEFLSLFLQF